MSDNIIIYNREFTSASAPEMQEKIRNIIQCRKVIEENMISAASLWNCDEKQSVSSACDELCRAADELLKHFDFESDNEKALEKIIENAADSLNIEILE